MGRYEIYMNSKSTNAQQNGTGIKEGKLIYLLTAQVLLIVTYPYFDVQGWRLALFRCLAATTLLTAIYAVSGRRRLWIIALLLGIPAAALNMTAAFHLDLKVAIPTLICTILFLGFTVGCLLIAVVRAKSVTKDTIYAAVTVYLMMAGVWALLYLLLHVLQPAAFSMNSKHFTGTAGWADFLFYSFVTLTSTGYGDIVPITAQARSLSILEMVSGTMYIAVLIARLVGVYASRTNQGAAAETELDEWSDGRALASGKGS
jgi:hypothetical protein